MLDKIDNKNFHCLIAHYNEDLEWVKNIKYPYTIISKNGFLNEISPNKGYEASSYLQYIIENYDNLSDYTIFLHGHRTSWHCNENMDEKINKLSFRYKYFNINDNVRVEPILMMCNDTNEFIPQCIETIGKIIKKDIVLNKLIYKQAAQFYVKKENILQLSKETYIELHNFLQETKILSWLTSRAFEYTWHYLFTEQYNDQE